MYRLTTMLIVFFSLMASAQTVKDFKAAETGKVYSENGFDIVLKENSIDIEEKSAQLFNLNISGIKEIHSSPDNSYHLIVNYDFSKGKASYPITLILLDNSFNETGRYSLKAFHGMPHPLFAVNNNGRVASFDLIEFTMNFFNSTGPESVRLNEAEFIDERQAYIVSDDNDFYLCTTIKPVSSASDQNNTMIYRIDPDAAQFESAAFDIATPTFFNLLENGMVLSGAKYNGNSISLNTKILDDDFGLVDQTRGIAFEEFYEIDNAYIGSFEGSVFRLDKSLNILSTEVLARNGKVLDIDLKGDRLAALTTEADESYGVYELTVPGLSSSKLSEIRSEEHISRIAFQNKGFRVYSNLKTMMIDR